MYLVKFADGWLVAGQKWRVAASFQIRAYSRLVLTVFWYLKICNLRTLSIAVKRGGGLGAVKCQAAGVLRHSFCVAELKILVTYCHQRTGHCPEADECGITVLRY